MLASDALKPVVILRASPHPVSRIFTPDALHALHERYTVVDLDAETAKGSADEALDRALPEAFAIIGQPDLPGERLARATKLRAVLNIEGNFYPNVDYQACFDRGIHILGCGPAYAQAVAEHALGLALDLARGISREDRAFREGRESYVAAGNADAILLRNADVGFLGFGNLGRALRTVLTGFAPTIRVYDPWLPASVLREHGVLPTGLAETVAKSTFLFVLATVTEESRHLLDAELLATVPQGARLVLVSRAPVVDYDALLAGVAAGRFLAGIDVWPEEPLPADHSVRALEGTVLSAHRAGGIPAAFLSIGDMVLDDLDLIARGLPPVRMQAAARELVGRYRNRPVAG